VTGRARLTLVTLGVVVPRVASFGWGTHPVCVPLDDAAVAEAAKYAPLEQFSSNRSAGSGSRSGDGRRDTVMPFDGTIHRTLGDDVTPAPRGHRERPGDSRVTATHGHRSAAALRAPVQSSHV
jgi:hypothetical protein